MMTATRHASQVPRQRELLALGKHLKALRERSDTFADSGANMLSMKLGLSESYLGMIERGSRRPSEKVLDKLCDLLDATDRERETALRLYGKSVLADTVRRLSPRVRRLLKIEHLLSE